MIRSVWAIARIEFREDLRQLSDLLVTGMSGTFYLFVIAIFYLSTGASSYFETYTPALLVWYLVIGQILVRELSMVVLKVDEDVKNGTIVSLLVRPVEYPLQLAVKHITNALTGLSTQAMFLVPVGFLLVGGITVPASALLIGCIAVLLAVAIDFCIGFSIALIAFWTESARPYWWIYQKTVFLFGGLLFPLDLLWPAAQTVTKALPTAYILYHPARILIGVETEYGSILVTQLLYLLVFTGLATSMYRLAIRKVSINGG